ncbi:MULTISPECIES: L-lactate dehydrogenase [Aerococcus]|uniref:L-lactate dehydrogenase n=3 Tax=Aerococcus TaxID=1375 RepID=A0A1E9PH05_9LACT|nr:MULTISPECIES: L-lactate dehydrogenase [Aerococcus]AEA01850.1 L-2-hydroxyisocaproate dehydrogenase [Aerococcus sp. Group 1]KAA9232233.1 L-lactate dehydrogenase [Aerococcus mictus]KAA9238800.1 L-lactate dehydrogenase [Aerococcus urinae]KAA9290712.1 L-lactate dehydrogenase [Aerococcus mictus]KAA9296185.1 L-lactate dehydrogenase [Aerococcus tenax]
MSRHVAVFGMGNVGSTVAHQLILNGHVDELTLFDTNEAKVKADALDFEDAMSNLNHSVKINVNDQAALKSAEVIVSALGNIGLIGGDNPDRFGELKHNREQVKKVGQTIKESGFSGVLVVITNPNDAICNLYQEVTGLAKEKVIGTGTLLDSARLQRAVGKLFDVHPKSVQGYSLGEHGDSQFVAWSTVKVMGQSIYKLLEKVDFSLEDVDQETRDGGYVVFSGKKYTNYGITAAADRLVDAVLSDSHEELPVSNYREEYGTYLSYPAIVGKAGIVKQSQLDLTEEELAKLQNSADTIKEKSKVED